MPVEEDMREYKIYSSVIIHVKNIHKNLIPKV